MPNYPRKKAQPTENAEGFDLPRLPLKHERFCKHILAGKSPSESYRLAVARPGTSRASIASGASELVRNPKISQFLRCFQRVGLEESAITRENHLAELARLREIAIVNQQVSAGVQAEHYRGRVAGLYQDKVSVTVGPSDAMLLSQVIGILGADAAKSIASAMGYEGELNQDDSDSQLLALPSPLQKD